MTAETSGGTQVESDVVLGIDLGTTNSLVAIHEPHGSHILGDALVPSVVAFAPNGDILVGDEAKELAFAMPDRVVHSVKRLIGRTLHEVRVEARSLPYEVVEGPNDQVRIRIPKSTGHAARDYAPEEVSAFVLRALIDRARAELGDRIGSRPRVVVTVPAYFDEAQRQATKQAAVLAGLDIVRLVGEPTAAALAYGVGIENKTSTRHVLVYDLGGGTFDVTLLKIQDGVFRVLATHGDTQLGGDDFDRILLERMLATIGIDASSPSVTGVSKSMTGLDPRILSTLRRSAEELKKRLSQTDAASVELQVVGTRDSARAVTFTITRAEFEDAIRADVDRTMRSVRAALADGHLTTEAIDDVVLVGGSTRIPLVRESLEREFGKPPHTTIDPDRAVALGAARQAAILTGDDRDTLLLDVVPLSLGLETLGGAFSKLIVRNTTVPCSVTEEFSTQVDHQTGIDLNVYQGERELVADCRHIGSFKLTGIPPMPAGLPRVAVTFTVDQHGLLRVSARELRSAQTASIEIRPTLGLSDDDVRRIVHESIEHANDDVVAREALDLRNKARAIVRGTENALVRGGDGLEPEQAYSIRKALARTKKLVDSEDLGALNAAVDELSSYTMQLADDIIGSAVRKALRAPDISKSPTGVEPRT
ncbi:MAG: Hsp70 family protein [Planctomycetes bacterium]|nr:Hsp70 family protein [Planctomycetota bacterium]